jgi:hypothetical protein
MVMNEAFLFAKIDTRWLRADKSNREDRQKLVHFFPTVYILYALFQKYREKKAFFVYHFPFCICFNSFLLLQAFTYFFRNACRLVPKTLLVLKQPNGHFEPQVEFRIDTEK